MVCSSEFSVERLHDNKKAGLLKILLFLKVSFKKNWRPLVKYIESFSTIV
jgi:hypothetical protein